jgi:chemotaxis protein histidine kinase CheA
MTKLTEVLSTKNPNVDPEDGHRLAYTIIIQTAQAYEHPPIFMSEDNEQITSNEVMLESVAEWMNIAAKVATGNRRRVLEYGRDVMNSDEEDAIKDVEADEEKGMYVPGCSLIDQARMSQEKEWHRERRLKLKLSRKEKIFRGLRHRQTEVRMTTTPTVRRVFDRCQRDASGETRTGPHLPAY